MLPRPGVEHQNHWNQNLHNVYHTEKMATKQSLTGKKLQVNTSEGHFFREADKYLGICIGI
jgi:hypothetical protein